MLPAGTPVMDARYAMIRIHRPAKADADAYELAGGRAAAFEQILHHADRSLGNHLRVACGKGTIGAMRLGSVQVGHNRPQTVAADIDPEHRALPADERTITLPEAPFEQFQRVVHPSLLIAHGTRKCGPSNCGARC